MEQKGCRFFFASPIQFQWPEYVQVVAADARLQVVFFDRLSLFLLRLVSES